MKKLILVLAIVVLFAVGATAQQINVGGKSYNQWRWTNAAGNLGAHTETPWGNGARNNPTKGNFLRSEIEFEVNASASKYAKVYLRMKTIFDADDGNSSVDVNSASIKKPIAKPTLV